jgi:glycosyltransferase involved in cell wall biosynthesis
MSCKKPVLMAIDGVSRELVEEADCGIFVEPENPDDFSQKVLYYKNNPDIAKKQGVNGYDFARKSFDRKSLAKKYVKALEELVTHV